MSNKSDKSMTIDRAMSLFNSVTNSEAVQYVTTDGKYTPIADAIADNMAVPASAAVLYTLNLQTCAVKSKAVNLNIAHSSGNFRRAFCALHYTACKSALQALDADFVKAWQCIVDAAGEEANVSAPLTAKMDAIRTRYAEALKIYNAAIEACGGAEPCDVVRDLYASIMGGEFSDATEAAWTNKIVPILCTLETISADTCDLKQLRPVISDFLRDFWRESDNCEKFVYKCSATLASNVYDVFRVVYQGRKLDRMGTLNRKFNYNAGKSELVKIVFEDLQKKAMGKPATEETPVKNEKKPA